MKTKYKIGQRLRLPYAERPAGRTTVCDALIVGMRREPGKRNSNTYVIHVYTPHGGILERHDETANITYMLRHVSRMRDRCEQNTADLSTLGRLATRLDTPPREWHNPEEKTMNTIRTTNIETIDRNTCRVGDHAVPITWDANGAHVDHCDLRAMRDAGHANWSDDEISDVAYHIETRMDETYTKAYSIAVPDGDGWHELDSIRVADDATANEYAEKHFADREWYVLDSEGNNING
jgi:hypothetical protein